MPVNEPEADEMDTPIFSVFLNRFQQCLGYVVSVFRSSLRQYLVYLSHTQMFEACLNVFDFHQRGNHIDDAKSDACLHFKLRVVVKDNYLRIVDFRLFIDRHCLDVVDDRQLRVGSGPKDFVLDYFSIAKLDPLFTGADDFEALEERCDGSHAAQYDRGNAENAHDAIPSRSG